MNDFTKIRTTEEFLHVPLGRDVHQEEKQPNPQSVGTWLYS